MRSRPERSVALEITWATVIVAAALAVSQVVPAIPAAVTITAGILLALLWLANRIAVTTGDSGEASTRALKAAPLPAHRYLLVIAIALLTTVALIVATLNQGATRLVAFGIVIIAGFALAELRTASYRPILTQTGSDDRR